MTSCFFQKKTVCEASSDSNHAMLIQGSALIMTRTDTWTVFWGQSNQAMTQKSDLTIRSNEPSSFLILSKSFHVWLVILHPHSPHIYQQKTGPPNHQPSRGQRYRWKVPISRRPRAFWGQQGVWRLEIHVVSNHWSIFHQLRNVSCIGSVASGHKERWFSELSSFVLQNHANLWFRQAYQLWNEPF